MENEPTSLPDEALLADLGRSLAGEFTAPTDDMVRAVRAEFESAQAAAHPEGQPAGHQREMSRWLLAAAAAAAALVIGLIAGVQLGGGATEPTDTAAGTVEFREVLRSDDGVAEAEVTGIKLGIGRTVTLLTDDLAILPKGEFYEVWFVGPDDSPTSPNRISAGTFHPDDDGVSRVTLTAAVDPKLYPVLSITAEPGDGDPAASEVEVLRSDIQILD